MCWDIRPERERALPWYSVSPEAPSSERPFARVLEVLPST